MKNSSKNNLDYILDGKLKMYQPKDKYCISIDSIFLGSSIKENKEKEVLDIGFGSGAVSFVLKNNNPKLKITGLEIQEDMIKLAEENIKLNKFKDIDIIQGDLKNINLKKDFDYCITNPPFFTGTHSPNKIKTTAHQESQTSLNDWLSFCIKRLKQHGTLSLIHMPEKLDEIIAVLKEKGIGKIEIFPLSSFDKEKANRVIIKGVKGSKTSLTLHFPIIIHNKDKSYTSKALSILSGNSFIDSI